MFYYVLLAAVCAVLLGFEIFRQSSLRGVRRKVDRRQAVIATEIFVVLALISLTFGLRWEVGTDWHAYARLFDIYSQNDILENVLQFDRIEPGYKALTSIFPLSQQGLQLLNLSLSALTNALFGVAIYKHGDNRAFCVFLFLALGVAFWQANTSRQALAAGFFFLALPSIWRGEPLRFLILSLLGGAFHFSIFLFLPIYLLHYAPVNRRNASIALFASGVIIFADLSARVSNLALSVMSVLPFPYFQHYAQLLVDRQAGGTGMGIAAYAAFMLFLLTLGGSRLFSDEKGRVLCAVCVLYVFFQSVVSGIWILPRLSLFPLTAYILFIPLVLSRVRGRANRALGYIAVLVFTLTQYVRLVSINAHDIQPYNFALL